ncbi:MAG TPA: ISNCY family transposase [Candidatus Eisenbacteria bacterium]|nr:ISNCY family transposase [Candidatus Eisenbacteria bacterium]
MRVREVLMRAVQRELTWIQAAEILGISARSMRRWKVKFETAGLEGVVDGRTRGHASSRRVRRDELERLLRLYQREYSGTNVRHFCRLARERHGLRWSYSFVRQALQVAGLVKKHRPRGRHRLRRPPRECFGEMLHLDGSRHAWLALRPDECQCLIVVVDDATRRLMYAQLCAHEGTEPVLAALHAVVTQYGVPQALYTDRAGWAAHTPKRGGPIDPERPTQVGRALTRLGVEHILAYSPQARGRSERLNRTLQDRLVAELRLARIVTLERANRFIRDSFAPRYNDEFAVAPAQPTSAFVTAGGADLDQILCHEEPRVVAKDNTVTLERVCLQIPKQPGRKTCAGLRVSARRHLDGTHSIWWGPRCLGRFDARGRLLGANGLAA